MKLTILGTQASYSMPGRANSSYLVSDNDTNVLLDIGSGSSSHLFSVMDPADLSAIVISHLHADHFADIYPLRLYLYFEKQKKLPLYLPAGGREKIGSCLSKHSKDVWNKSFDFKEICEQKYKIGNLEIEFVKVHHLKPTYAAAVSNGEQKIVYTSDSRFCPQLVSLCENADILLSEATFDKKMPADHMTALDAGTLAKEAKVKKMVLTHIWPALVEENQKQMAESIFRGAIDLAREGKVYEL